MEFFQTIPWLTVHISAVTITIALVIMADTHGLLWLLGKMKTLPERRMRFFHAATWVGLVTTMTAGAIMFSSYPEYLLSLTAFKFKMLFVAALCINAFLIGKHMKVTFATPFSEVPDSEKRALLISGAVSTSCWIGAYWMAQLLS